MSRPSSTQLADALSGIEQRIAALAKHQYTMSPTQYKKAMSDLYESKRTALAGKRCPHCVMSARGAGVARSRYGRGGVEE